jgi:hypothetical protein
VRRAHAAIRQRIGRYDRAARAATERGDWEGVARYVALLDRDLAQYERATGSAAAPVAPDTVAAQYTPERTVDWSDDDLILAWGELGDDPAAQDQIIATLDWRATADAARDAEIAGHEQRQQAERQAREQAWREADADASPLTNPARRPGRRLRPEQVCREEYDGFVYTNYLAAESECRGQLLTREGVAKGIDPATLFSGPAARARKYASPELRTWWARHGRITYSEWRYQWFGRESDRAAATTARHQSLGEATA